MRRNTRELILETSLSLFNLHGEPNITTNHIADEADISPGNLYYHFRSKDDISLELFKLFLARMQPLLQTDHEQQVSAEAFSMRLHLVFEVMGQFRFLYRNMADLQSRISNLRRAFHGLLARQRAALLEAFQLLQEHEVMSISEKESVVLAENMSLQMIFWIPFAEIQNDPGLEDGTVLTDAVSHCLYLVIPYLQEPEQTELRALADIYRSA